MEREQENGEPTPEGTGNTADSNGVSRTALIGAAVAVIGVLTTGLLVYVLARTGPPGAEKLVWILGYGATIFALWYLLLRPIDFSAGDITEQRSVSSRTERNEVPHAGRSETPRATGRRPVTAGQSSATQSGDSAGTGGEGGSDR